MAEFPRIDPKGKTQRELLEAVVHGQALMHECVHRVGERLDTHIVDTKRLHAEATQHREALAGKISTVQEDVRDVKSDVSHVKGDVATLKDNQVITEGRVTNLAKALGTVKLEPGESRPQGRAVATWGPGKFLVALSAAGGCLGFVIFAFQLLVRAWPTIRDYIMSLSPT